MNGAGDAGEGVKPPWDADGGLEVGVAEVAEALAAGQRFRLIDCREEDEHAICRLQGAELMPLGNLVASGFKSLTDVKEVVVVYCHHGMRSGRAVELLRARGCPLAFSMAGGIDLWSLAVDPGVARY